MAAKYASANVETVGSNIIAVIALNRSLLFYLNHLSRFLGAKHFWSLLGRHLSAGRWDK
jgi:hypothetical protein